MQSPERNRIAVSQISENRSGLKLENAMAFFESDIALGVGRAASWTPGVWGIFLRQSLARRSVIAEAWSQGPDSRLIVMVDISFNPPIIFIPKKNVARDLAPTGRIVG